METTAVSNSYDEVPYESFPFPQSHPDRMATIAALFGLKPAPLATMRVLELGCASGGNLLPMADQFPDGQFVGVDSSSKGIEAGQRITGEVGIRNVKLLHRNILELGSELGEFDYIIAHGVFSWVPRRVQEKILDICRQHLSQHGVAYISYNTNPGWRLRGTIRDLMCYRASFFTQPADKLHEARALLDFLAASVPTNNNPYGLLLSGELEHLRTKENWYLFHEYLEEINEPEYFHQFMSRAQGHGLQYLGEVDYSSMSASNFPPEVETTLRKLASDVVQTEQYMDLVRNRTFRQTLLCHEAATLDRSMPAERIFPLYLASSAEPEKAELDVRSREQVTFRRPGSTLTTKDPLVKAAMAHLRSIWPAMISFRDLLIAARARLQDGPVIIDAERDRRDAESLARPLLRCYATTHIDLHVAPSRAAVQPTERPLASRLARYQAGQGAAVNLWHEVVRLSDFERRLLSFLDGETDLEGLADRLAAEVQQGRMIVQDAGRPLSDVSRVREVLAGSIPAALQSLGRRGFLVATADPKY